MPAYVTAVVGHGIAAPAYMSALFSVCTAVFAFRVLPSVSQLKSATPTPQIGLRAWRALAPMSGLIALECLGQVRSTIQCALCLCKMASLLWLQTLEAISGDGAMPKAFFFPGRMLRTLLRFNLLLTSGSRYLRCLAGVPHKIWAQVFIVAIEMVIAVTTHVYFDWLIDAIAVFMLFIAASGVLSTSLVSLPSFLGPAGALPCFSQHEHGSMIGCLHCRGLLRV